MVDFNEMIQRALRNDSSEEDTAEARASAEQHFNEEYNEIAKELMDFTLAAHALFVKSHKIDDMDRRSVCTTEAMDISAKMFAYISVMGLDIVGMQEAGELQTFGKTVQLLSYTHLQELIMVKGTMQKMKDGIQT